MANHSISRRAMLPAAVAGAAALAVADPNEAAAQGGRRYTAFAGPAGVSPGQTLLFSFLLPAVMSTAAPTRPMRFQLSVFTIGGNLIGSMEYFVTAGMGAVSKLQVFADGSVRFDDKMVDLVVAPGTHAHIIAILIGLLLPAVQKVAGTVQCANNLRQEDGQEIGTGPMTFILPYIEQK